MTPTASVLYLAAGHGNRNLAQAINTKRRKMAMEQAGASVELVTLNQPIFLLDAIRLFFLLKRHSVLYIRIDGTCALDIFTLVSLARRNLKVIWEIHGFPEEALYFRDSTRTRIRIAFRNAYRKALSRFVHKHIFVSRTLQDYAEGKLHVKSGLVIPNFRDPERRHEKRGSRSYPAHTGQFTVVWTGNAALPWHALDLLEKTARHIYARDTSIRFLVIGSGSWYKYTWKKNIRLHPTVSEKRMYEVLTGADIGLALYKDLPYMPIYFSPLKILDYMAYGLPTIATDGPGIREMVVDGRNGYLAGTSVTEISERIVYLRNHPQQHRKIGTEAYSLLQERYGFRQAIRAYRNILGIHPVSDR